MRNSCAHIHTLWLTDLHSVILVANIMIRVTLYQLKQVRTMSPGHRIIAQLHIKNVAGTIEIIIGI